MLNILSVDRQIERLVYLYLLKKTNFCDENLKLLHIAPEERLSAFIKKRSNIDYLTADIDLQRGNVMVKMDITQINYPDNTFDVVICNHVLEHIIDDHKAMSELFRVLKPNGWGILQVPISLSLSETFEDASVTTPEERERIFGQSDHVRIYAMDYVDRLKKSGFDVEVFNWQDDPQFSSVDNKYGLIELEKVFVVHKPEI